MNLIEIEEHQVRDLVFAQVHYLYVLLKATSAYVIIPMAKVPRSKYSSYQYCNRIMRKPAEHQQMQVSMLSTNRKYSCKGVHSLLPNLGCFDSDGLVVSSLWSPPEVWANEM